MAVLWSKVQKVLSEEIQREQLKHGDHIYTCRPDNYSKSHHGIYMGDGKVIYLAGPKHGVLCTSIDNFIDGGKLCRFEYGVNPILLLAKPSCTLMGTDTPKVVKHRASLQLEKGFRVPRVYKKDSKYFAVYCKTGLLSTRVSRSEQAASLLAIPCILHLLHLLSIFTAPPASLIGWAATGVVVCCTYRLASDIGAHPNISIREVVVEDLVKLKVEELGFLPTLRAWIFLVFSIWVYLVFAVPECILLFCWATFQGNFNFRSWVPYTKIRVNQLKPGDHIYTWRGYTYTHHGIYAGNGKVIHAVRGRGSYIHSSSSPFYSSDNHVESISIKDFVCGGELYLYKYSVYVGYFIAKIRGGACTLASSDLTKYVLDRANFLLVKDKESGVIEGGAYDLFRNNCEDFAIYCKTGLAVRDLIPVGRSGQITCLFAAVGFLISFKIPYLTSNLIRLFSGYFIYSTLRIISDTRFRKDACRTPIEQLANFEKSGGVNYTLLQKLVLLCQLFLLSLWCMVFHFLRMGRRWATDCHIRQRLKWIMWCFILWQTYIRLIEYNFLKSISMTPCLLKLLLH